MNIDLERLKHQYQVRCVHYNGTVSEVCLAGVRYDDVRDETLSPYGYPCLADRNPNDITCDKRRFMSDQEAMDEAQKLASGITSYFDKLARNECPKCGERILEQKQVGRCVYAYPCGHRLYQGKPATRT
jgi:hypothetical protein